MNKEVNFLNKLYWLLVENGAIIYKENSYSGTGAMVVKFKNGGRHFIGRAIRPEFVKEAAKEAVKALWLAEGVPTDDEKQKLGVNDE